MNTFLNLFLHFVLYFAVVLLLIYWYFSIQFNKYKKTENDIYKLMRDLTPEEIKLFKEASDKCDYYSSRAKHALVGFLILLSNYFLIKYLLNNSFFSL